MSYRLLAGAAADTDRILLESAREFGIEAAGRYDLLLRSVCAAVGACPDRPGSQEVSTVAEVRVYPLHLGRRFGRAGPTGRAPKARRRLPHGGG